MSDIFFIIPGKIEDYPLSHGYGKDEEKGYYYNYNHEDWEEAFTLEEVPHGIILRFYQDERAPKYSQFQILVYLYRVLKDVFYKDILDWCHGSLPPSVDETTYIVRNERKAALAVAHLCQDVGTPIRYEYKGKLSDSHEFKPDSVMIVKLGVSADSSYMTISIRSGMDYILGLHCKINAVMAQMTPLVDP